MGKNAVFETSFKQHGGHAGRHAFLAPIKSNQNFGKWPKFLLNKCNIGTEISVKYADMLYLVKI